MNPSTQPLEVKFPFVAAKNGRCYYASNSPKIKRIKPGNLQYFESQLHAVSAGLKKAKEKK